MLSEGLLLMAVGMVTVFAFLSLLVGLMVVSARFFAAYGDRLSDPEPAPTRAAAPAGPGDEAIAVVLAAIEAHRRGRGGAA